MDEIILEGPARKPQIRASRIAVSVFFFSAGLCFASWASRIPNIQQKLKLNEAGLGSVLFALPIGLMSSLPLAGYLVARTGSRRVSLMAALSYALMLPLIGLVNSTWQLVLVLYLFGAAGNLLNISINTQGVSIEDLYKRSIMASFHGVWSLAGFTGAAIGTVMVSQSVSPFTHFCIVSALVIIGITIVYRYLLSSDISGGGSGPIFARPDKVILKLGLIAMCCMICEGTMFDWSGVYFRKEVHAPRELTTIGYVAFLSTMAGGRFAGDWLSTHFGKKKMIQMSGLIIAAGLMIAVLFPYLLSSTLGLLLVGMGVSSVVPLVYGAAGRSRTMSAGMALAAVSTIGYIGFLLGPPLIGFIAQAASLRWSFSVIAVLGLFTSILALNAELDE